MAIIIEGADKKAGYSMHQLEQANFPESKEILKQLKVECAKELGLLPFIKENNDHDKGDLPARLNGQQGGPIGGLMVKKIFERSSKRFS